MYQQQDKFSHLAKKKGYRARSVFKLKEINEKYRILSKNSLVCDWGASPGSWLQYIAEQIKPQGLVYGLDLKPIAPLTNKNIIYAQADILNPKTWPDDLPEKFQTILSDLAPSTQGIKFLDSALSLQLAEALLTFSQNRLTTGGHICLKIFAGEDLEIFYKKFSKNFSLAKKFKPSVCRTSSKEIYLIGKNFFKSSS